MGRCKSLGSLKSFLWYAPQPSGASILSILCFLILSLLRVYHWGGGAGVEGCSDWGLGSGSPFVSILSSLQAHRPRCVVAWWLQHPLFTDMAGSVFSLMRGMQSDGSYEAMVASWASQTQDLPFFSIIRVICNRCWNSSHHIHLADSQKRGRTIGVHSLCVFPSKELF